MNIEKLPHMNPAETESIKSIISSITNRYKEKFGRIDPPICEKTLCKIVEELKGIVIRIEPEEKTCPFDEGLLIPIEGGFRIKYRTTNPAGKRFSVRRIRNTVCHELAHTFFFDCLPRVPQLQVTPPEPLCHDIARRLLLPEEAIRETFNRRNISSSSLAHTILQLSRDFEVDTSLVATRLTTDLSLIKDALITFWNQTPTKGGRYRGYRPDSRLSPELKELLPPYWKERVHMEEWDKVISRVVDGKTDNLPQFLSVRGEKRKKGRIKDITFEIQYELPYDGHRNLRFELEHGFPSPLRILSVKILDIDRLR